MAAEAQPRRRRRRQLGQALLTNEPMVKLIGEGNYKLMTELHKFFVQKVHKQGNFVYSPYGASACLSLMRAGAAEQTSTKLCKALKIPTTLSKIHANLGHKTIYDGFNDELPITLTPRGGQKPTFYWITQLIIPPRFQPVAQDFIQIAQNSYGCEVLYADLTNKDRIQEIHTGIAQRTGNKVQQVFRDGEFAHANPMTMGMVFSNVLYFKSLWEGHNGFDPRETKLMDFTLENGNKIKVPMMRRKKMYASYSTFLQYACSICALYFEGGRYALMIYFPRVRNRLGAITMLEQELDKHTMQSIATGFVRYHNKARRGDGGLLINVSMPKFTANFDLTLNNFMSQQGVKIAFTNQANFSDIRNLQPDRENIFVSQCFQKCVIEIDDSNSPYNPTAAVFPYPRSQADCRVKTKCLCLDSPFVFSIFDYINNVNIATGTVYNPLLTVYQNMI